MPAERQIRRREPQMRGRPAHFRPRAWKPVIERRRRSAVQREEDQRREVLNRQDAAVRVESGNRVFFDHEYYRPKRSPLVHVLFRTIGLASDITLLVLLSPFFAAWFLYRAARAFLSSRQQ
jgi:hypothetical protein